MTVLTVAEADNKANKMRAETQIALDNLFAALRQANLLIEFPPEDWAAYNTRHFGHDRKFTSTIPPEPNELGWKDPHRLDPYDESPE